MDYAMHPDYAIIVDVLAKGIKKSTQLVIGSLGIMVELSALPSWDEYAALKRRMYHGFTSTRSYRFLFPGRYRKLYHAYIDAQVKIQNELLERVLGEGQILDTNRVL